MTNIKFKQLAFVFLSSIAITALTQTSALACVAGDPGCTGNLNTTANSTTNITVNLNGDGLRKLNELTGVVIPTTQVNSGAITSKATVDRPVANTLITTSTAIGNVVSFDIDRKTTTAVSQFNKGNVTAHTVVQEVAGGGSLVTNLIDMSSTAIGNVFSAKLNLDPNGNATGLAAAIAQCNTGNITAATQYLRVDPDRLSVASTAIGNVASIANTGVKISVK